MTREFIKEVANRALLMGWTDPKKIEAMILGMYPALKEAPDLVIRVQEVEGEIAHQQSLRQGNHEEGRAAA